MAYNQSSEVILEIKEGNWKGKEYSIIDHKLRQLKFEWYYINGERKSKTDKNFCNFF